MSTKNTRSRSSKPNLQRSMTSTTDTKSEASNPAHPPPPPPLKNGKKESSRSISITRKGSLPSKNGAAASSKPFLRSHSVSSIKGGGPLSRLTSQSSRSKRSLFGSNDKSNATGSPQREHDVDAELRTMMKVLKKHPERYNKIFSDICQLVPATHRFKLKAIEPKTLTLVLKLLDSEDLSGKPEEHELLLDVFARLLRAKALFKAIQKHGIDPLIKGLAVDGEDQVILAALNVAKHIVTFKGVTAQQKNVKEMIQVNKQMFHDAGGFAAITDVLKKHYKPGGNTSICRNVLELFSSTLCSETNTLQYTVVRQIMELLKPCIASLLRLSTSNNTVLAYHSTVLVQCLLLHSNQKTHDKIQRSALRTGCFLRHFYISVQGTANFEDEKFPPLAGDCESRIQHESRMLMGLFIDGYSDASNTLKNALPTRLVSNSLRIPHKFEYRFEFMNTQAEIEWLKSTAYRRYAKGGLIRENWLAVFDSLRQDVSQPDLMWNDETYGELMVALRTELVEFQRQQAVMASSEWHWEGFEVIFPSLERELRVGGFYVRLLLPALEMKDDPYEIKQRPLRLLVGTIYDRAVIEDRMPWKLGCLRLISTLFKKYPKELTVLEPLPYFVWLLDPKHTHPLWRDHILDFLSSLLTNPINAKEFVKSGGLDHLNWYIRAIHCQTDPLPGHQNHAALIQAQELLHTSIPLPVPPLPPTNTQQPDVDNQNSISSQEKENSAPTKELLRDLKYELENKTAESKGTDSDAASEMSVSISVAAPAAPVMVDPIKVGNDAKKPPEIPSNGRAMLPYAPSPRTIMSARRSLSPLGEPAATNRALVSDVMNPPVLPLPSTAVAKAIEVFVTRQEMSRVEVAQASIALVKLLCTKLPRLKKSISRHVVFETLVEALICDEEAIVSDTTSVLLYIIQDNPFSVPRLAETGLFLYLVYCTKDRCTNDIAKLLHWYHNKQNNQYVRQGESALAFMLPAPLVAYLENFGPEQFLTVMNTDVTEQPDLIWNNGLRELLYASVSDLVSDVRERIRSDLSTKIPCRLFEAIVYPTLVAELCVSGVYVRVFNEQPDFNLRDPAHLLDGLVAHMKNLDLPSHHVKQLLGAQITMVKRFAPLAPAREYPCFTSLLSLISREYEGPMDVEIATSAANLCYFLLTMKNESDNRSRCVNSCGVHETAAAMMQVVRSGLQEQSMRTLMLKVLSILNILCYKNPPALAVAIDRGDLFVEFSRLIDLDSVESFPDIAHSVLQTMTTLVASASLLKKFVENGTMLYLIRLLLCYPKYKPEDDGGPDRIMVAATRCISAFANDEPAFLLEERAGGIDSQEEQNTFHAHLVNIFRTLLTPGIFTQIHKHEKFLRMLRSDAENPLVIWNSQTRSELGRYLDEQLPDVRTTGTWKQSEPSAFSFTFSQLRHDVALGAGEIIVYDIYVRLYNEDTTSATMHNASGDSSSQMSDLALVEDEKNSEGGNSTATSTAGIKVLDHPKERVAFVTALVKAIQNCTVALKEMTVEAHKLVAFDYLTVVARALTKIVSHYSVLLQANHNELKLLRTLLVQPNSDIQHGLLVVLRCLASSPQTIEFVAPNVLHMHALLNVAERSAVGDRPSMTLIMELIALLCLEPETSVASKVCDSGILASLLWIMASRTTYTHEQRLHAANVIGVLANDPQMGGEIRVLARQLLANEFEAQVLTAMHDPEMLVEYFDQDHDTPLIFWNDGCRRDLLEFLRMELDSIQEHQSALLRDTLRGEASSLFGWSVQDLPDRFVPNTLSAQLCIDDVYIHALNANPFFPVDTETFWPKLIEGMQREFRFYRHVRDLAIRQCEEKGVTFNSQDPIDESGGIEHAIHNLSALWEALRNLITNQPSLQSACVDNIDYFFEYFHPHVASSLQLVALTTVKSLSTNPLCAERVTQTGLMKDVLPLLVTLQDSPPQIIEVLDVVMNILRRSSDAVDHIRLLGGLVIILHLLLNQKFSNEIRFKASTVISAMAQDHAYGHAVVQYVLQFVTSNFRTKFSARPDLLIHYIDSEHDSPNDGRSWSTAKRDELCAFLAPEGKNVIVEMSEWDMHAEIWDRSKLLAVWPQGPPSLVHSRASASSGELVTGRTPGSLSRHQHSSVLTPTHTQRLPLTSSPAQSPFANHTVRPPMAVTRAGSGGTGTPNGNGHGTPGNGVAGSRLLALSRAQTWTTHRKSLPFATARLSGTPEPPPHMIASSKPPRPSHKRGTSGTIPFHHNPSLANQITPRKTAGSRSTQLPTRVLTSGGGLPTPVHRMSLTGGPPSPYAGGSIAPRGASDSRSRALSAGSGGNGNVAARNGFPQYNKKVNRSPKKSGALPWSSASLSEEDGNGSDSGGDSGDSDDDDDDDDDVTDEGEVCL